MDRGRYKDALATPSESQAARMPVNEDSSRTASITACPPVPGCRSGDPTGQPLFLDLDDQLCSAQFLRQPEILADEFLILLHERIVLGLGSALVGTMSPFNGGLALLAPRGELRRIESFTAEKSSDAAGLDNGVGFDENALFVFSRRFAAFGFGDDFWIGARRWLRFAAEFGCYGPTFGLASLASTAALRNQTRWWLGKTIGTGHAGFFLALAH